MPFCAKWAWLENYKNWSNRESCGKVDPQTNENSIGKIEAKCLVSGDWFMDFEDRLNRTFRDQYLYFFIRKKDKRIQRLKRICLHWRKCTFSIDQFERESLSLSLSLFLCGVVWRMQTKRTGRSSLIILYFVPARSEGHVISGFVRVALIAKRVIIERERERTIARNRHRWVNSHGFCNLRGRKSPDGTMNSGEFSSSARFVSGSINMIFIPIHEQSSLSRFAKFRSKNWSQFSWSRIYVSTNQCVQSAISLSSSVFVITKRYAILFLFFFLQNKVN